MPRHLGLNTVQWITRFAAYSMSCSNIIVLISELILSLLGNAGSLCNGLLVRWACIEFCEDITSFQCHGNTHGDIERCIKHCSHVWRQAGWLLVKWFIDNNTCTRHSRQKGGYRVAIDNSVANSSLYGWKFTVGLVRVMSRLIYLSAHT